MSFPALQYDTLSEFRAHGTKFLAFNPQGDAGREAHWKSFERVRMGFYGQMTNVMFKALNEQLEFVLDNVRQSRTPSQTMNAVRSATGRMRPIYERRVRELTRTVIPRFAELTLESFPKGARRPVEQKQDDEVDYWLDVADRYVTNNAGTLITAPNETTRQELMGAARVASQRGLQEGWGMDRIAEEIQEESEVAVSRRRATVIARTEVIRASNHASLAAARSTNMRLRKEWIATQDNRVRDTHDEANGQIVPMEDNFNVGGYSAPYPAAPTLPPKESVQCRCTVAYLSSDD